MIDPASEMKAASGLSLARRTLEGVTVLVPGFLQQAALDHD